MKFQCDRCKTRYSIADERVRGKILKIRCKNCEAVVTVREGMAQPGPDSERARRVSAHPASTSKPALRGAFERAMESSASPPAPPRDRATGPAPQQLAEEWYVSVAGDQRGPFELEEAKRWVADQPPDAEVFCWTEGFDDWLPVHKVAHFRRPRRESVPPPPPRISSPLAAVAAGLTEAPVANDVTPEPLFAAALAAIERDEANGVRGPKNGGSIGATSEPKEFDFDVGEASRVVRMPMLVDAMGYRGSGAAMGTGLPGLDRGELDSSPGRTTGAFAQVQELGGDGKKLPTVVPLAEPGASAPALDVLPPRPAVLKPWHLVAGLGAIAASAAVLIIVLVRDDGRGGDDRQTRSRFTGEGLGYRLDPRERKLPEAESAAAQPSTRRGPTRRDAVAKINPAAEPSSDPLLKSDDVDLGGDSLATKPLTPDEVMRVYNDNKLGVKLCYESALKKDPLLDVKKLYVSLSVEPTGVVSAVSMSGYAETPLGQCLAARIKRWRFRQSSEPFTGQFPLVFRN
jgi:predicted Zn finger-like uncharacterized protein